MTSNQSPFSLDYREDWTLLVQFRRGGKLSREYQIPNVPPFWAEQLILWNRKKNFRKVASVLRRLFARAKTPLPKAQPF